jgi:hypothetical protein
MTSLFDERSAKQGIGNEWIRWMVALALAALVSYFTTTGTMENGLTEVKTTENAHFEELLRRVDLMQQDIREIRQGQRER